MQVEKNKTEMIYELVALGIGLAIIFGSLWNWNIQEFDHSVFVSGCTLSVMALAVAVFNGTKVFKAFKENKAEQAKYEEYEGAIAKPSISFEFKEAEKLERRG